MLNCIEFKSVYVNIHLNIYFYDIFKYIMNTCVPSVWSLQ